MSNITLVIINDDAEEYLYKLFESLKNQAYIDCEIVFIDNCSKDNSIQRAEEYGVKSMYKFEEKVKSRAELYNKGYEISQTEYIVFAHSDVYFYNDFFKKLEDIISGQQTADFLSFAQYYADLNYFGNNAIGINVSNRKIYYKQLFRDIPHGVPLYLECSEACFMVNRKCIETYGFNSGYKNSFYEFELLSSILNNNGIHSISTECKFTHYFIELHEKLATSHYDNDLFIRNHGYVFELINKNNFIAGLQEQVKNLSKQCERIEELTAWGKSLDEAVREKDGLITSQNARIEELSEKIKSLDEENKNMRHSAEIMKNASEQSFAALNKIYKSRGWKLLNKLYKLESKVIPLHSKRRKILKAPFLGFKNLKFSKIINSSLVKPGLKRIDMFLLKHTGGFYRGTFAKLKAKLRWHIINEEVQCGMQMEEGANYYWTGEKPIPHEGLPLVSVIVPNYNHSAYLRERLDTVYEQDYPNFEVILLDDHSTDNSVEILQEYAKRYPQKTTTLFNNENAGMVFRQWNKGIGMAKGEYVWIAESDDYSSLNFLSEMVPLFEYQSVRLAFTRSVFIQDGQQIWNTEEYLADLPELKWDKPFMMTAHMAVNKGFAIKNIIPNVSSTMFRNIGELPNYIEDMWGKVRLVGDWIFYLDIIRGGTISYTNKTTNFYRVHKDSTSLKIQKTMNYYDEYQMVSKFVAEHYKVDFALFDQVLKDLERHFKSIHQTQDVSAVREHYSPERACQAGNKRIPNIVMCCFSMKMGGGETYPLFLANEMKRKGAQITLLDFALDTYDSRVRSILNREVPLVELKSPALLAQILYQLGAEIVHSHHASVDNLIGIWHDHIKHHFKHIISLHGMYESIQKADLDYLLDNLSKSNPQFVYTADKNLFAFKNRKDIATTSFIKMGNGLPRYPVVPMRRDELGIEDDAFVLCLVSRALDDKGWTEAIHAVEMANRNCERPIHLILIGEGEAVENVKGNCSQKIHYLGVRADIRNYYAMSDIGFLPSRFRGESFPLVIIDSLMSGKPVLASDIGEIRNMVTLSDGRMAGVLFPLINWTIDMEKLTADIVSLAKDKAYYNSLCANVEEAAEKFDISTISQKYMDIYRKVLS